MVEAEPDVLAAAVGRHRPDLLICSALDEKVTTTVPAWLLLHLDGQNRVVSSVMGELAVRCLTAQRRVRMPSIDVGGHLSPDLTTDSTPRSVPCHARSPGRPGTQEMPGVRRRSDGQYGSGGRPEDRPPPDHPPRRRAGLPQVLGVAAAGDAAGAMPASAARSAWPRFSVVRSSGSR